MNSSDLASTLQAIDVLKWTVVLLERGTKRIQAGRTWDECSTQSSAAVRTHLRRGGGIGLDVASSGLVVLDLDRPADALLADVGPIPAFTATSPSGGFHVYCTLPAKLKPSSLNPAIIGKNGERYGEVIRGPHQQVVMPPSPYPGNEKRGIEPGGLYRWLVNPLDGLYILPPHWVDWLTNQSGGPDDMLRDAGLGQAPDEVWTGPSAEVLLQRAAAMPRSKHRANGVKFQCPQCAQDGHDKHFDNAIVMLDGRWGCAYAPGDKEHTRSIGAALNMASPVDEDDGEALSMRAIRRSFLR